MRIRSSTIRAVVFLTILIISVGFCEAAFAGYQNVGEIRRLIRDGYLKGASVGILIQDMDTGKVLLSENADRIFIPASNMKIVTAGASILALGPRYRFYTDFFAKTFDITSGEAAGLYVKGYGDPAMKEEFHEEKAGEGAEEIARQLKSEGLRRLTGVLWLDDSFFSGSERPETWEEEDLKWCYAPRAGALSAGGNCLRMEIRGDPRAGRAAHIEFDPAPDPALLVNRVKSVSRGGTNIEVEQDSRGVITVSGTIRCGREIEHEYPVPYPALFYGSVLTGALKRAGVEVAVRMEKRRDVPAGYGFFRRVASVELVEALEVMGRHSDNFIAEQMIRLIGALKGRSGTHAAGTKVASDIMKKFNIATDRTMLIDDGSGLSRANRLTPRVLNELLYAFYNSYLREEFKRILASPGDEGTLKKRLKETNGRFWAKTGALRGVCSLSGYYTRPNGNTAAFTMIMNGYSVHSNHIRRIQDLIVMQMMNI